MFSTLALLAVSCVSIRSPLFSMDLHLACSSKGLTFCVQFLDSTRPFILLDLQKVMETTSDVVVSINDLDSSEEPPDLKHQPVSYRNFAILCVSETISCIGDVFYITALPFIVLKLTGNSSVSVSGVMTAAAVPRAILMPFGGKMSDVIGLVPTILLSNIIRALVALIFSAALYFDWMKMIWMYVFACGFAIGDAFLHPALSSAVPVMLPKEKLEVGNGIQMIIRLFAWAAGPALAGIIIGLFYDEDFDTVDKIWPAIGIDFLTFVAGFVGILLIRPSEFVSKGKELTLDAESASGLDDCRSGESSEQELQTVTSERSESDSVVHQDPSSSVELDVSLSATFNWVWNYKPLVIVLFVMTFQSFSFQGSFDVATPLACAERFENSISAYSIIMSGFGIGMMIGTGFGVLKVFHSPPWFHRMYTFSCFVYTLCFFFFEFIDEWPFLYAFVALVAGLFDGIAMIPLITWTQRISPPHLIGQVISIYFMLSEGVAPIGLMLGGVFYSVSSKLAFWFSAGAFLFTFIILVFSKESRRIGETRVEAGFDPPLEENDCSDACVTAIVSEVSVAL